MHLSLFLFWHSSFKSDISFSSTFCSRATGKSESRRLAVFCRFSGGSLPPVCGRLKNLKRSLNLVFHEPYDYDYKTLYKTILIIILT